MANPKATGSKGTAIEVVGVNKLLRVLSKIPKELQAEVRDASQAIANDLVSAAKNAAHTPTQRLVAGGLKARRDRVPVVATSGSLKPGVRTRDVFYGAEFGGGRRPSTQQFPPHRGRLGYFFYPTARARGAKYADMWGDAIDKAFKDWNDQSAKHGSA